MNALTALLATILTIGIALGVVIGTACLMRAVGWWGAAPFCAGVMFIVWHGYWAGGKR